MISENLIAIGAVPADSKIDLLYLSSGTIHQSSKPVDDVTAAEIYFHVVTALAASGPSPTIYESKAIPAGGDVTLSASGVGSSTQTRYVPFIDLSFGENKLAGIPGEISSVQLKGGNCYAGDDNGASDGFDSGKIIYQVSSQSAWIRIFPWIVNSGKAFPVPITGNATYQVEAILNDVEGRATLIIPGHDYPPLQSFLDSLASAM